MVGECGKRDAIVEQLQEAEEALSQVLHPRPQLLPKLQPDHSSRCLSHLDQHPPESSGCHERLAMDAPGANTANGGANKGPSEPDTSRIPPADTNPDEHERRHASSDDDSEGCDHDAEEEEEEESDEEDEEPRLKYAYLTKHLGSVYRNGDATSTFLVAGDKMVGIFLEMELLSRS